MENNPYAPPASSVEGAPEVARENVESGLGRGTYAAQTAPELSNFQWVMAVFSIPLYLLALYIGRRITRDQSQNYAGMVHR